MCLTALQQHSQPPTPPARLSHYSCPISSLNRCMRWRPTCWAALWWRAPHPHPHPRPTVTPLLPHFLPPQVYAVAAHVLGSIAVVCAQGGVRWGYVTILDLLLKLYKFPQFSISRQGCKL